MGRVQDTHCRNTPPTERSRYRPGRTETNSSHASSGKTRVSFSRSKSMKMAGFFNRKKHGHSSRMAQHFSGPADAEMETFRFSSIFASRRLGGPLRWEYRGPMTRHIAENALRSRNEQRHTCPVARLTGDFYPASVKQHNALNYRQPQSCTARSLRSG